MNVDSVYHISLAKVLIRLRHEKCYSQGKLAMLSGMSRKHVSAMEVGSSLPTLGAFCRLAKGFGLTPVELMRLFEDECGRVSEEISCSGK
jgi:transcriptional regulator with XRE-family HTH domain